MLPSPLSINPVSLWRRGFLLLIFLLSMLACILLKSLFSIALLAILLGFLVFYWRRKEAACQLLVQESGDVEVHDYHGRIDVMQVLPSSVVTEILMVLHLKSERQKLAIVLWPDTAPPEVLRQWRVWLRWTWRSPHE